jgi:tryptophanyl-tRNA synthetase
MNGEMRRLMDVPGHIDAVLAKGAAKARVIAEETMADVKDIIGFL